MSRDAVLAIALGALSGVCVLALASGNFGAVILSYLSPLPLFLAALAFGLPKAVLAAIVGTATVALLGPETLLFYLFAAALPVLLLSRQALLYRLPGGAATAGGMATAGDAATAGVEWYPPDRLVVWLAGIAAFAFVAASLWCLSEPGGLPGLFEGELRQVVLALAPGGKGGGDTLDAAVAARRLAPMIPPILAVLWQLVMAANGALAQGLAHRFGRQLRPSPDLARLELPPQLAWLLVALVAARLLLPVPTAAVETLVLILAVPFFFQGLGVVHALTRSSPARGPLLVAFYLLLMAAGVLMVLVAALGVVEQWAHLRRRHAGRGGVA